MNTSVVIIIYTFLVQYNNFVRQGKSFYDYFGLRPRDVLYYIVRFTLKYQNAKKKKNTNNNVQT